MTDELIELRRKLDETRMEVDDLKDMTKKALEIAIVLQSRLSIMAPALKDALELKNRMLEQLDRGMSGAHSARLDLGVLVSEPPRYNAGVKLLATTQLSTLAHLLG